MEPLLDAETMEIHHGQHHAAYIARLNELLRGRDSLSRKSLAEIMGDIRAVPQDIRQDVRNHGGAHLNHSLFWHVIGPPVGRFGPSPSPRRPLRTIRRVRIVPRGNLGRAVSQSGTAGHG